MMVISPYKQLMIELESLYGGREVIDMRIKEIESQMEGVKNKIIKDYFEYGLFPDGEFQIRNLPKKVIVIDESKIPEKFFKVEKKLDKKKLNQAYFDGEDIDGVALDNGGVSVAYVG